MALAQRAADALRVLYDFFLQPESICSRFDLSPRRYRPGVVRSLFYRAGIKRGPDFILSDGCRPPPYPILVHSCRAELALVVLKVFNARHDMRIGRPVALRIALPKS